MSESEAQPDESAPPSAETQWPITITLGRPFDFGKEHIASLTFRRGTLADIKGLGAKAGELPSLDQLMMIASRMCGKPLKVIEMLDADDAEEVMAVATIFFAKCLPGGRAL